MKQFNKEQIEILSQWEDRFYAATVGKYYRNVTSKVLDEMKKIFDTVLDEPFAANWSCNHCILTFITKLGKKYYEDKKALEELVKEITEPKTEEKPATPKKPAVKKTNNSKTKKTSKK